MFFLRPAGVQAEECFLNTSLAIIMALRTIKKGRDTGLPMVRTFQPENKEMYDSLTLRWSVNRLSRSDSAGSSREAVLEAYIQ